VNILREFKNLIQKYKREVQKMDKLYFGDCPKCGQNDGYLNIERTRWKVCHKDKMKWRTGGYQLSNLKYEDHNQWIENIKKLAEYHEVTPIFQQRGLVASGGGALFKTVCAICGIRERIGYPYWIFLEDTTDPICIHSAEKYAAILSEIVEAANENHWNKEKSDRERNHTKKAIF